MPTAGEFDELGPLSRGGQETGRSTRPTDHPLGVHLPRGRSGRRPRATSIEPRNWQSQALEIGTALRAAGCDGVLRSDRHLGCLASWRFRDLARPMWEQICEDVPRPLSLRDLAGDRVRPVGRRDEAYGSSNERRPIGVHASRLTSMAREPVLPPPDLAVEFGAVEPALPARAPGPVRRSRPPQRPEFTRTRSAICSAASRRSSAVTTKPTATSRQSAEFCEQLGMKYYAAETDLAWATMLLERNAPGDADKARELSSRLRPGGRVWLRVHRTPRERSTPTRRLTGRRSLRYALPQ